MGVMMNEGCVFNIGEMHAGQDINNVAGDLIINQNSSAEDVFKIIKAIQWKSSELDIDDKNKKEYRNIFHKDAGRAGNPTRKLFRCAARLPPFVCHRHN